jgi:GNAT superfamily N-acetyltransferase
MEIRAATEADGEEIARVRLALGSAHDDSGADPTYRRHLIAHGQLLVARDHDAVVGFVGTRDIDGARLLCDLFIDPERHGHGIGQALLDRAMEGATSRWTFSSADPRALPLYLRAGMYPRWPLLYLTGATDRLSVEGRRFAAEPASLQDAVAIERALSGQDRTIEYRYWLDRPGTLCLQVGPGSGPASSSGSGSAGRRGASGGRRAIAVAVLAVDRHAPLAARLEHVAVATGVDPLDVVGAVCLVIDRMSAQTGSSGVGSPEHTGGEPGAGPSGTPLGVISAYVRGASPLAKSLLDRGFKITDSDTAMSTSAELVPDVLHILHPGLM